MPPTIDAELRALAAAVREIRARQQLSQERVASRGGVGRKYVGQIERGEIIPSFAALVALSHGLDVPLSELVRVYEERLKARAPVWGWTARPPAAERSRAPGGIDYADPVPPG